MLITLLSMLFIGLIAGFVARAVVPGDDSMSVPATIGLGVVGSFVGGFLGFILFGVDAAEGAFQASGLFGAIIGAIVALLAWRAYGNRAGGRGHLFGHRSP